MKRLVLVACLCILAFVLAPVAAANAETFKGACTISGTTKFWGLKEGKKIELRLSSTLMEIDFLFLGGGKCVLPSGEVVEVHVHVEGKGSFTCAEKGEGTATGYVEATSGPKKGTKYEFELGIDAAGGSVVLHVKTGASKEETAKGTANFYLSKKQLAAECPLGGVEELEFNAVAAGEI